jgi:tRNA pseudouridine55 synthase
MKDGIFLIDKPAGITSHDVVEVIREKIRDKKVGHGGTLDPLATGLLIILIGRATKLSNRIISQDKLYEGELCLGFATDTGDLDGKVTSKVANDEYLKISQVFIKNTFNSFLGEGKQIPPMYSALKYKGTRLYKLARKGIEVPRSPRKVFIYEINVELIKLPYIKFKIRCSRGLYIRKFCEDIGEKLGYPAHLTQVRRLSVGNFKIEDSLSLDRILSMGDIEKSIIPINTVRSYLR